MKVSFIIPVYNVEKFLPQCLDSIINQTVQDIEVICINDCSPDNSQRILESYAANDSRIRLIEFKDNKGPGAARNAGLDAVSGEFIRMVDADDFIPEDSTEKLLNAAVKHESDYVRGGFRNSSSTGMIGIKGWNHPTELIVNTNVKQEKRLWRFDQHWSYLFRTKALRSSGARYDESMRNGQDAAFMVDLMPALNQVTFIPETVYYYRNNPSSIMRRKRTKEFYLNVIRLYEKAYKNMMSLGVVEPADYIFYQALSYYLPNSILSTIRDNLDHNEAIEVLRFLHEILIDHNGKKLCFDRIYSWQEKQQMPLESKYITVMLCDGYLEDVFHDLKRIEQGKNERKSLSEKILVNEEKLQNIYTSTSWKITSPMRRIAGILGKKAGN